MCATINSTVLAVINVLSIDRKKDVLIRVSVGSAATWREVEVI